MPSSREEEESSQLIARLHSRQEALRQEIRDAAQAEADAARTPVDLLAQLQVFISDGRTSEDASSRYQRFAYVDDKSSTLNPDPLGSVSLNRLVRMGEDSFAESINPVFLQDVLVYIQGVEVSEFVVGTVHFSRNGLEGHNRATLVLDNEADRFVWTERNLASIFGFSHPRVMQLRRQAQGVENEVQAAEIEALTTSKFTQNEKVKRSVYDYKSNPTRNPTIRSAKNVVQFARFDLAPNRAIFARMDPIRIFTLYPWRVPGGTDQLWIPEFSGYIENVSIEDNDITGQSSITIEAVDIVEAIMRRMRISADASLGIANPLEAIGFAPPLNAVNSSQPGVLNPLQAAAQQEAQERSDHFFNPRDTQFYDDIVHDTVFGQEFFPNSTMEEAIKQLLVFNPSRLAENRPNRGVRAIELGGTLLYDAARASQSEAQTFFQEWHKFCLFGPKRRPWTRSEVDAVGSETKTDGSFNPNASRLWFLLPAEGSGPRNLANLANITANITHEVNWTTRAEVLRGLLEALDYRGFVSPTGDVIIEFPMADFRPEDFGEFRSTFRIDKNLISSSFGDEQDEPIAGLIVKTGFTLGKEDAGSPVASARLQEVFAFSPYIAARYGISVDLKQLPFLLAKDKAVAQQRAIIEFQKRNARCNVLTMSFSHRPFLLPNRPLHHLRRTRMGLTVSIDTEFEFGSSPRAATTASLEHVRTWTGHYRSPEDLETVNEVQRSELEDLGGFTTAALARGIDSTSSPDPLELQVFNTIMAGESTPTSARSGWGTDGEAISAPASGVYLIDPQKRQKEEQASNVTFHEESKADEAAVIPNEPSTDPSLHKFKSNPLSTMIVTSNFDDPRSTGPHRGTDLDAKIGDLLFAVDDGTVEGVVFSDAAAAKESGGKQVRMLTAQGYSVLYLHMSQVDVRAQQRVTAGQVIGKAGNTGNVQAGRGGDGSHLHIEVSKNGARKDPMQFMPGPIGGKTKSRVS